jgi:hypothetical protein
MLSETSVLTGARLCKTPEDVCPGRRASLMNCTESQIPLMFQGVERGRRLRPKASPTSVSRLSS